MLYAYLIPITVKVILFSYKYSIYNNLSNNNVYNNFYFHINIAYNNNF